MLKRFKRAANDLDLDAMTRSRGSLGRNLSTVSLPVATLSFGAVYLKWRSMLVASLVAVGIFAASAVSNIRFFKELKRRERLKTNPNAVEVFEVSASHALEIEHLGSNGPAFCIFVENGKALLLVGQWILESDSFPSESFRLYCWADTMKPIRLEPTGQPTNTENSNARLRPSHRFRKVELFDAMPGTLQADLDNALNKKSS